MKDLVVIGAGTAGTALANRLARCLPATWRVTVVEPEPRHCFQPDLPRVACGLSEPRRLARPREQTLLPGIRWVERRVEALEPDARRIVLANGDRRRYDLLAITTGCRPLPGSTPGVLGRRWRDAVHDFHTLEGALALRRALAAFRGGRLLVAVLGAPIKGAAAPARWLLLIQRDLAARRLPRPVCLTLATPLSGPPLPGAGGARLAERLAGRGIRLTTGFEAAAVRGEDGEVLATDGRRESFDLLVIVPRHGGAAFLAAAGLADEEGFVPVEPTLFVQGDERILALGDAARTGASKEAWAARAQAALAAENVLRAVRGAALAAADPTAVGESACGGDGPLARWLYFRSLRGHPPWTRPRLLLPWRPAGAAPALAGGCAPPAGGVAERTSYGRVHLSAVPGGAGSPDGWPRP